MKDHLKSVALAVTVALGIAGVAHAAEQPGQPMPSQMPQPGQPMGPQMMGQPGGPSMMNNPEMRQRMATMMEACQQMMSQTGAGQGAMSEMRHRQ